MIYGRYILRQETISWLTTTAFIITFILCNLFVIAALAHAQETPAEEATSNEPGGSKVPDEVLSPGEKDQDSYEESVAQWSERVTSTATYMDSFFDTEKYVTTSNRTYARFRISPIYDRKGLSFNTYVDIRLLLPNTERWMINFGGDPDKEDQYGSTPLEDDERENSGRDERNAYLGLNTFLKRTRTRNVGLGGGVRFTSSGIVPYGTIKWVELWEFKNWDLRATQRLRYYTDIGPEFKSELDFEWPIAHKFFARTNGAVVFKRDDPDVNFDIKYQLYQYLTTRRALRYQIITGYRDQPSRSTYLDVVNYEVQYRQQWRNWFYTNITPQLRQTDSRDWELEPGIRFDFNFRFGHQDEHKFRSRFDRKQENLEEKAREDRDKALEKGRERLMKWMEEQEEKERKAKEAAQ